MGQKNDQMLAHLAQRIGKLSRRNVALVKWGMEAEDRARQVKAQLQGEMAGLKARLEADLQRARDDRDQLRSELEAAQRSQSQWPTEKQIDDYRENGLLARGVRYVSPHLTGEWKLELLRTDVPGLAVFHRLGDPIPDRAAPSIIVDLNDADALCFTEAPF